VLSRLCLVPCEACEDLDRNRAVAVRVIDLDLGLVSAWSSPLRNGACFSIVESAEGHMGEGAGDVPYGREVVLLVERRRLGSARPMGLNRAFVSWLVVRGFDSL
jgi:hypothetical protein